MAEYNLGTAHGVIEIEYKGDGATQARRDIQQTGKLSQQTGPAIQATGRAAGLAGAAIAGGFALAVKSAGDFEARMSAIGAVSGASQAELDSMREKALQLGKDTAFSAGESAAAIEELIKAGLSVEDVLNGAADATVSLAAAGEVDMVTAASVASNAMNQFNLSAEDMTGVVDQVAGAANASAIDVNDFALSLSQVGAVANLAGATFDDTATAIAMMGNAGIKGSDAGTSLKTMLMNLQPSTDKQAKLFRELGIVTEDGANKFYDAQGHLKSLSDVAGILQGSLRGMTDAQKQAALEVMFGSDAIRAASVFANAGAKGFDNMSASMGKVSAADVAAKRMDNMKGSLEQLKGSLETMAITVGTILLPAVRNIVDHITDLANRFLELSPGAQKAVAAFAGLAGGTLLALAAFVKLVKMLQTVKAVLAVIRASAAATWLAALGPIALVIAAVAAVIAIFVVLWKKSDGFRSAVTTAWNAIKTAVAAVAGWFTGTLVPLFQTVWSAIGTGLSAVAGFFTTVWGGIRAFVAGVVGAIAAVFTTAVNIWNTVISGALAVIGAVWRAFWGTFGGVIKAAFGLVTAVVKLGWTIIKGVFLLALRGLLVVTKAIWSGITAVFRAAWAVIGPIVMAGVNAIRAVITTVFNAIRGVTTSTWNGIRGIISAVWGAIRAVVGAGARAVGSLITGAWNAVKSATTAAWNGIKSSVSNAVGGLLNIVGSIKNRIVGALAGAGSWLVNAGKEIIQGLLRGIESMIGAVTDKIRSVTDKIAGFLPGSPVREGPLQVLNRGHAGRQIIKMVVEGIADMQRPLERTVTSVMAVPTFSPDLGRLAAAANTTVSAAGVPSPAFANSGGAVTQPARSRLVEGRLTLDSKGRAFIRGLAEDVYAGNARFAGAHERMG